MTELKFRPPYYLRSGEFNKISLDAFHLCMCHMSCQDFKTSKNLVYLKYNISLIHLLQFNTFLIHSLIHSLIHLLCGNWDHQTSHVTLKSYVGSGNTWLDPERWSGIIKFNVRLLWSSYLYLVGGCLTFQHSTWAKVLKKVW